MSVTVTGQLKNLYLQHYGKVMTNHDPPINSYNLSNIWPCEVT